MKGSETGFAVAPTRAKVQIDDAARVLCWIDGLVTAGLAEFDGSEGAYPILILCTGEMFTLGDSSVTRLR